MSIQEVPIRATIRFGGVVVRTPYILSFNVNKVRNTKTTFSASLKVEAVDLNRLSDNKIVIRAGVKGGENKIFTGYILNSVPSPCWDDPRYVILNVSGADVLYRLENERYTRRQATHLSKWALITSVQRKAPKGAQFKLVQENVILPTDGDIATDDQKNDKQIYTTDLSRFGVPIISGNPKNVVLKVTTLDNDTTNTN